MLLTNADLDHVLGLFLLREGDALSIFATPAVHECLSLGVNFDSVAAPFTAVNWRGAPAEFSPLPLRSGEPSGLHFRAIRLPAGPPRYMAGRSSYPEGHSIAFEIQHEGRSLLVAPDVSAITPELQAVLKTAEALLFDGTFWVDGELQAIDPSARTSMEMGHLPVSTESLPFLRTLPAQTKVYLHINNTNPMLLNGKEREEVEAAGLTIGEDGMEFAL